MTCHKLTLTALRYILILHVIEHGFQKKKNHTFFSQLLPYSSLAHRNSNLLPVIRKLPQNWHFKDEREQSHKEISLFPQLTCIESISWTFLCPVLFDNTHLILAYCDEDYTSSLSATRFMNSKGLGGNFPRKGQSKLDTEHFKLFHTPCPISPHLPFSFLLIYRTFLWPLHILQYIVTYNTSRALASFIRPLHTDRSGS